MGQFSTEFGSRVRTISHAAIILTILVLSLIHLRSVIEPFIIAVFIYFLLAPGAHWLNNRGVPLFPSYALVVTALGTGFFLFGMWLYQDITKFAEGIPEYSEKLGELMTKWEGKTILGITISFDGLDINTEHLEGILLSTFGEIGSFVTLMITVFVYLIFIILEAETLPKRVAAAYPNEINTHLKEMIADMSDGVYRYVRVKTIVSFGMALTTAIVLFIMGVPGWLLWSALTFILNYVPVIGGLIATLPPAILAILLLDPTIAIGLIIILIINQQLWGQFIENKMFGTSLNISPIIILLVTVFWFWLWGIMGMVLAIPMAVVAKIILSNIPETRPISILLSEKAPSIEEE
jgi:predicted PurR-regulated permease PerM